MFATISRTFALMRQSWRVLMQERELILLPIMAGVALLLALGAFAGIAGATGSLSRLQAATGGPAEATPVDIVLSLALLVTAYFITMFFNSALIAAAMVRLRGGDATVGYGLRVASSHLPAILGWALIAATVGLVLSLVRDRLNNELGRFVLSLVGGVWTVVTFFVIPLMVVEGHGPIAAIKRSGALMRQTWGQQIAASFGFGLVYVLALVVAIVPAALLFAVSPLLGIVVGVPLLALAMGTVQALEGIFKAALYDYATGSTPHGFDQDTLRGAYRAL